MTEGKSTKNKRRLVLSGKVLFAAAIVWYLVRSEWFDSNTFIRIFQICSIPYILGAAIFFMVAQMLCSARLALLLKTIQLQLTFFSVFRLVMVGNFFNSVIPGVIGGDFIKGIYLMKMESSNKGQSSGIIIMDRVFGILAIACIGCISLLYLLQVKYSYFVMYQEHIYIVLFILFLLFGFFSIFVILGRKRKLRTILSRLAESVFKRGFFYNIIYALVTLAKHKRAIGAAFSLSIFIQLFSLAGLILLTNIAGRMPSNFLVLAAVSSFVILISVIPVTPGNIGWTELIAAVGWSAVGSDSGAEVFLFWRIVYTICSLPGLLFYFGKNTVTVSADLVSLETDAKEKLV